MIKFTDCDDAISCRSGNAEDLDGAVAMTG
jgi:hypothetical protein